MVEFWLLAKIGMVIKGIVWGGYSVAGSYLVRTGVRYVQDYIEYSSREDDMQ